MNELIQSFREYLNSEYSLEYALMGEEEAQELLTNAVEKYQVTVSKWCTSGQDTSAAHEVGFQAAKEHIDSAAKSVMK